MHSGSTIPIRFLCALDLSTFERVLLTFKCSKTGQVVDLEKDRLEFSEDGFSVRLTQEEALLMEGVVKVQARYRDAEGFLVDATSKATMDFDSLLKPGPLEASPHGSD